LGTDVAKKLEAKGIDVMVAAPGATTFIDKQMETMGQGGRTTA
jgi:hypothetical protein